MCLLALGLAFVAGCGPRTSPQQRQCDLSLRVADGYFRAYMRWSDQLELKKAEVSLDQMQSTLDNARRICPVDQIDIYDRILAASRIKLASDLAKYGEKLGQ